MQIATDTLNTINLDNNSEISTDVIQKTLEFEVKILTKDLSRALGLLNSVVEKKNIIPILSNTRLSVQNDRMTITATDGDLSISEQVGVQVIKEGKLTVAAKTLNDIVRHISDETILLKYVADTAQLLLIGKNCQFNLSIIPADQFPSLEQAESITQFQISNEDLLRLLDKTRFSISNEETRYNLNGIYFHVFTEDKIKYFAASSTDGHRLSLAYIKAPNNIDQVSIILPKKSALELQKILRDSHASNYDVQIDLSSNKAKFTCNKITLISKLIDGNFPDYQAFIPKNNINKLSVSTKHLASAINRVATITIEKFRAVKLKINNNGVEFSAFGEARGSAMEHLQASAVNSEEENSNLFKYDGEEISIGFNPKYIIDILETIKGKEVSIELKDSFSPALLKDTSDPLSLFVVMPIKV